MTDTETMGAPASPYEACQDVLREWDGKADPAYVNRLRMALFDAELSHIRNHVAPMVQRLIDNAQVTA
jgi:hypothetical protein